MIANGGTGAWDTVARDLGSFADFLEHNTEELVDVLMDLEEEQVLEKWDNIRQEGEIHKSATRAFRMVWSDFCSASSHKSKGKSCRARNTRVLVTPRRYSGGFVWEQHTRIQFFTHENSRSNKQSGCRVSTG